MFPHLAGTLLPLQVIELRFSEEFCTSNAFLPEIAKRIREVTKHNGTSDVFNYDDQYRKLYKARYGSCNATQTSDDELN